MRLRFLLLAALASLGLSPARALAQGDCNEKCVAVREGSQIIGWSCVIGGTNRHCQATTTQCSIVTCGITSIRTGAGELLASVRQCDIDSDAERRMGAIISAMYDQNRAVVLTKLEEELRREENRAYALVRLDR